MRSFFWRIVNEFPSGCLQVSRRKDQQLLQLSEDLALAVPCSRADVASAIYQYPPFSYPTRNLSSYAVPCFTYLYSQLFRNLGRSWAV